jgi:3'-5' exoribonuclease
MPPKPPIVRLHEMQPGDFGACFAMLSEKNRGLTRDHKPFYQCRFKHPKRSVGVIIWENDTAYDACDTDWQIGQFFKLTGQYLIHDRYGPQLHLTAIRPANTNDEKDGFHPIDFTDRLRQDPETVYADLVEFLQNHFSHPAVRTFVLNLLQEWKPKLLALPAHPRAFYPYAGGLIFHTRNVVKHALFLCDQYRLIEPDAVTGLDRDLLLAGAALHEIGRARELVPDVDHPQVFHKTIEGQLTGHLILGRDIVRDAGRAAEGLPGDFLLALEHLILSHLQLPEWGSPRLPALTEVLILHHADDLDAKVEMYLRAIRNDGETGAFTAKDAVLGRELWKRGVSAPM